MALSEAILRVLNDDDEPLAKRMKIAENAFRTTEYHIKNKESKILKWAIDITGTPETTVPAWNLVHKWLSSKQFQELTSSEISNEDAHSLILMLQEKLRKIDGDVNEINEIIKSVQLLHKNKVFQLFFQHRIHVYNELMSELMKTISCSSTYATFLKETLLCLPYLLNEDSLEVLFPTLVSKVSQFPDNEQVYQHTLEVIQKGLLQSNQKDFRNYFDEIFSVDKNTNATFSSTPKNMMKFLISRLSHNDAPLSFKLFFAALNDSLKDFKYSYKFLLFASLLLGFDISKDFQLQLPIKKKPIVPLSISLNVILSMLEVLSNCKIPTESEVSQVSLTDFLRKLLKSLIAMNVLNLEIFHIILKCISINPLIIESMASTLMVYLIQRTPANLKPMCEEVIESIFKVFEKLHRLENFIAKLVPALKSAFVTSNDQYQVAPYEFHGEFNLEIPPNAELLVEHVLSSKISACISQCLKGLVSWQVINVFKTLLFHLKESIQQFVDGMEMEHFLELLSMFTVILLQTSKIADHTIPDNVVTKFQFELSELKHVLKMFSTEILKRQYDHVTMRTFLNLAYNWAEVNLTLIYYFANNEAQILEKNAENDYPIRKNPGYLHSYMEAKEWEIIVQRITNFGQFPCKILMQKLQIQKLRAGVLLENKFNQDIMNGIIKTLPVHLEATWPSLFTDRFVVHHILPKLDPLALKFLAERIIDDSVMQKVILEDSEILTNVTLYVLMTKIVRCIRVKKKRNSGVEAVTYLSEKVLSRYPEVVFFDSNQLYDVSDVVREVQELLNQKESNPIPIKVNEEKLIRYLKTFKAIPVIYCGDTIQKLTLLYLIALAKDARSNSCFKQNLECLIEGMLQECRYCLLEVLGTDTIWNYVFNDCEKYDFIFGLIVNNLFKLETSIKCFGPIVLRMAEQLQDVKCLTCSLQLLQAIKVKKSKNPTVKDTMDKFKNKIFKNLSRLLRHSDVLHVEAYATCLKHYISIHDDDDIREGLVRKLPTYLDYSLANINENNKTGCVMLFTLVLQNRTKLADHIRDGLVMEIWQSCRKSHVSQKYLHLTNLIVSHISNEEFPSFINDFANVIDKNDMEGTTKQIKVWNSIVGCHVNPSKGAILQQGLQTVLQEASFVLNHYCCHDDESSFIDSFLELELHILREQLFNVSGPLMDLILNSVQYFVKRKQVNMSISIMETALKYRNPLIVDRLPVFLQQYRCVLGAVTSLDADHAHALEKLTRNMATKCKKDLARIGVFLLADILNYYERFDLQPAVKLHLNNCVYSLMTLCDHHSIVYLMRSLSEASREMFKIMHEHYKKYYMFTGKV
ncbi:hypothetical protein ABEB36_001877 [Hypothenemus hampei]|uniref:Nucleolar 27S pre-rRNA processing Urb2/Npa2 C-terminal domain-containing protein n=1 Tax=Hypothenemus hampei TaxID=57062 RepID=A0ABD1FG36_HYPHA